ncbi:chromosomal replication initiator protein DnaA, partial [bacterium]|nr:chromosomal replication initiator protein DnaA [bacterium]
MPTQSLSLDQDSLQALGQETCNELTASVSPLLIDAWGKTCTLHQIEDFGGDKWLCTFLCPSSFNALQFEKNLSSFTKTALAAKLGRPVELKFIFNLQPTPPTPVSEKPAPMPPSQPSSEPPQNPPKPGVHSRISSPSPTPEFTDGLFASSTVRQTIVSRAATIAKSIGLRPDFTFDTFAVSGSNEMAHVAAMSVAKNPGVSYNPLFLYGGVGVGKTHLMQSIGNYILAHQPETKIIYCTGEEFTNSIIKAIQTKQALNFKDKYRTCEVLLIDDIQFIAGKNAVQEEFFHTFNALAKQNHQIVLTSDRPPHEISLLEDRLRSRFEAGLKIDIQQPSFELRSAILLAKATSAGIELPMELAQTIASRIDSARKLEGIVMRLKSESELGNHAINQDLVNHILSETQQQEYSHRQIHPKEILSAVANHYSIKQAVICGTRRQKEIATARHVAMFLLKSLLSLSYSEIGRLFSTRDHTSCMHAVNKI